MSLLNWFASLQAQFCLFIFVTKDVSLPCELGCQGVVPELDNQKMPVQNTELKVYHHAVILFVKFLSSQAGHLFHISPISSGNLFLIHQIFNMGLDCHYLIKILYIIAPQYFSTPIVSTSILYDLSFSSFSNNSCPGPEFAKAHAIKI